MGANLTTTLHDALGAKVVPQVLESLENAKPVAGDPDWNVSVPAPVLVMVKLFVEDCPIFTLPKSHDVGAIVAE